MNNGVVMLGFFTRNHVSFLPSNMGIQWKWKNDDNKTKQQSDIVLGVSGVSTKFDMSVSEKWYYTLNEIAILKGKPCAKPSKF